MILIKGLGLINPRTCGDRVIGTLLSGQNFTKIVKTNKTWQFEIRISLEFLDQKRTQIWIFIVLVASLLPYFGVKVGFRCISVHIWLSNQVLHCQVVVFTIFAILHGYYKLCQSQGSHKLSGLSTLVPFLWSYLTVKVGFGLISANIRLPDTVMYGEVGFL